MSIKRISSIILAVVLVLALAIPAYAATGEGTITINDSLTDGTDSSVRTFKAYKILDVDLSSGGTPVYHVPSVLVSFYETKFGLVLAGETQAKIDSLVIPEINALTSSEMELFAEAALAAAKSAGITPVTLTGEAKTSAAFGYYVIEDISTTSGVSRVSAVMIDTTTPDAVLNLKADTPSIDKSIDDAGVTIDTSNGSIGDTVKFKIAGKVPDMTGFEKYYYVLTDTLSAGLALDAASIAVKVGTTTLAIGATDGSTGGYHVNYDAATGKLEIVLHNFIQYKALTGTAIEITYSAKIDDDAVIGVEGNPNAATLIYSNNPKTDVDGKPGETDYPKVPVGETPQSKTYTYTAGIELKKVDEDGEPLSGAVFTLEGTTLNRVVVTGDVFELDAAGTFYKLLDETYTTTAPTADTAAKYASVTDKYTKTTKTVVQDAVASSYSATGTVDDSGILRFDGLGEGTYTLTEVVAPSGYSLLADPLSIVVDWTAPADLSVSTDCTWSFAVNGGAASTSLTEGGRHLITIENIPSNKLPSTGGMGTTIFTIGGLVLMAGAVLLLVVRRKVGTQTKESKNTRA